MGRPARMRCMHSCVLLCALFFVVCQEPVLSVAGLLPLCSEGCYMLRVLIFIPAYEAEQTIVSVLGRIPETLALSYDVAVLVIDDGSKDKTFETARRQSENFWCPCVVLRSPENHGYGGNQKLGYQYAMDHGFDVVAMVHGDGQYAPECLPDLLRPFASNGKVPDAVYGSRMMSVSDARKGGMPVYKILANKFLTKVQNWLLGTHLSEFHSGYRLYRVDSLRRLPLSLNSDGFDFDTEIIIQVVFSGGEIAEHPIPTFYGDEICRVNGVQYAMLILRTSLKARLIRMGLLHDARFETEDEAESAPTGLNSDKPALETIIDSVPESAHVLVAENGNRTVSKLLRDQKQCHVYTLSGSFEEADDIPWQTLDMVVLADNLESEPRPKQFLLDLHARLAGNKHVTVLASSANVAFLTTRLSLLFGRFSRCGHDRPSAEAKRLFTCRSLTKLLDTTGFCVTEKKGSPAPYEKSLGEGVLARLLTSASRPLAKCWPGLFGWRIFVSAAVVPDTAALLKKTER